MVVAFALAFLDGIRTGHLLAVGADDGPQEWLVGLADGVPREKFAIIFHGHAVLGFFNREVGCLRRNGDSDKHGKNVKASAMPSGAHCVFGLLVFPPPPQAIHIQATISGD